MFNLFFWKDAAERAIATMAQALVAVFGADQFNLIEADWIGVGAAALTAGALSVLKALAAARNIDSVSPASLARERKGYIE